MVSRSVKVWFFENNLYKSWYKQILNIKMMKAFVSYTNLNKIYDESTTYKQAK